jgi:predicted DNA-binding protein YlxM (UPF0122 family)
MPLQAGPSAVTNGRARSLEERTVVIGLFDAYAGLLSERQRRLVRMYYHDDLSLGEIAERHRITRQAVFDTLRRAIAEMERLERHLAVAAGRVRAARMRARLARLEAEAARLAERHAEIEPLRRALGTLKAGL